MSEAAGFNSAGFNSAQLAGFARQTLEDLESEKFRTVRRGYDPRLVEKRMREAAGQIRSLLAAVEELSQRVDDLESASAQPPELDAGSLTAALGDEAVRVLDAARIASEEKIDRAEMERVEILEDARSVAAEIIQEGKAQGRDAVTEAREVRERILDDLAHKRQARRLEVEQLRAVRGKMLESLTSCRQLMDSLVTGLVDAMPQAAAAAERAGLRVSSEPEPTASQIEAEIEAARMAGLAMASSATAAGMPVGRAFHGARHEVRESDTPKDAGADAMPASDASVSTGHAGGGTTDTGETGSADSGGREARPEEVASEPEPSTDGSHPLPDRRSGAAGADVYDMEAETSEDLSDAAALPGLTGAGDAPKSGSGAASFVGSVGSAGVTSDETKPVKAGSGSGSQRDAREPPRSNVEDIFARLRSISEKFAVRASDSGSAQPGEPDPTEDDDGSADSSAAPAESTTAEEDDAMSTAGAVAVSEMTRNLKRVLIEDQSELLDAIRRLGRRAVITKAGAGDSSYAGVLREPLQRFVSEIDASIDDLDLNSAAAVIASTLEDPVRSRLRELAEDIGNTDELSTRVRAVYKESRIHRAPLAAEAAFAAAWPELPAS